MNKEITDKLRYIGKWASSTFPTICNTYELAERCIKDKIGGDFVECGVGRGAQIAAMVLACQINKDDRLMWAYDSYQGIPLAGKQDTVQPGIGKITHDVNVPAKELLKTSGAGIYSVQQVKENILKWGLAESNIKYVEGWFEDTMPKNKIGDIALLRLDGDLYSSTKICLKYLYPKLVKGGYLIIDDYALTGCYRATQEYFKEFEPIKIVGGLGPVYIQKLKHGI